VLVDLASDGQQFAVLARHVRRGGTAITTRYVADRGTLARAGVTGVNFQLPVTVSLLDRLAAAVVAGTIMAPPIIRIRLDEVPDLMSRHGHAEGKTVIIM
jgi:NADPH:quinone reductase